MSTTAVTPTPSESLGQKIKDVFSKIGRDLEAVGAKTEKIIAGADKELPVILPALEASLAAIFPKVTIPVATINKIATASLNAASAVSAALNAEGLNATADEVAATTVAALIHGTGASAAAVTSVAG